MGKLTDTECKTKKAEGKDEFLSDGGGLYLRVRQGENSKKVWLYRFKSLNGSGSRWFEIGTYPEVSLKDARLKMAEPAAKRRAGIDPIEDGKAVEAATAAAEAAAAKAAAQEMARVTVGQLLDLWQSKFLANNRKDGGAEIRRSFVKDILPVLGEVKAEEVTQSMIASLLDGVVQRGSKVIAGYLLADLKQMFKYAIRHGVVEKNPCGALSKVDYAGKKVERDRVLSEGEIRELQTKIPAAKLQKRTEAAIWLMLATGARVGELSRAKWAAVDLAGKVWDIPKEDAKNKKGHTIYLSDFAIKWFDAIRNGDAEGLGSQWVFPAMNKSDEHVCLKSIAKQVADRQRDTPPMKNRSQATGALKLSGGSWTPHDLRRTAATMAGGLGVQPMTIERMLNHQNLNPLIRIYQHQALEAEQREGWRLLGARLELLTSGAANVVTFKRTA